MGGVLVPVELLHGPGQSQHSQCLSRPTLVKGRGLLGLVRNLGIWRGYLRGFFSHLASCGKTRRYSCGCSFFTALAQVLEQVVLVYS